MNFEIQDAQWSNAEHTYAKVIINTDIYGVIPYTAYIEEAKHNEMMGRVWEALKTFNVKEYQPEPEEKRIEYLKNEKREERNKILKSTDVYMISDYPLDTEVLEKIKQYRNYLRNFTENDDWYNTSIKTLDEFLNI